MIALLGGCSAFLSDEGLSGGGGSPDGGTLPAPSLTDCKDPAQAGAIVCHPIDSLSPGSVGSGPAIDWVGVPRQEIVGGFAEPGRLVLAVKSWSGSDPGALIAVDLASGERTLIAGALRTVSGQSVSRGSGWGFQELSDVVPAGDRLLVHTLAGEGFDGWLIDVDRSNGNASTAQPLGAQCDAVLPADLFPRLVHPALAPDASVYLAADSVAGQGIVKQVGDNCELALLIAAGDVGFGANYLAFRAGKLWTVDWNAAMLSTIDTGTGAVDLVSGPTSENAQVALGRDDVAIRNAKAFTVGAQSSHVITEVAIATGARTPHATDVGPLRTQPTTGQRVWMHPELEALLIAFDGAVVIYDPATDNANTLSY